MGGISVTVEELQNKYNRTVEIDTELDAALGGADAGKRAIANDLSRTHESAYVDFRDKLVEQVGKFDEEKQVAAFTGIISALRDSFGKTVDAYLERVAEERKTDSPQLSQEAIEKLMNERRGVVKNMRLLREMLEMYEIDTSSVPEPKKRTGAIGKRGPRSFVGYNFYIDGKARSETQNNLSSIANTVCNDMDWKTADLRNWLAEQGLDLQNPTAEWSYTLPNGKVLSASRDDSPAEDEGEEDDEDDEEVEDE